jgi:hypothetical protein
MPDIPSFFNKIDFFGTLLPGYIGVILYLAVIRPDLVASVVGKEPIVSFDLFFAVVFLVAGQALGYTIRQLHRYIYSIIGWISNKTKKSNKREKDVYRYTELRVKSSTEEKLELDGAESAYDFSISTAVILFLIGSYYYLFSQKFDPIIAAILQILGLILLMGGILERKESYGPIYYKLMDKHKIQ